MTTKAKLAAVAVVCGVLLAALWALQEPSGQDGLPHDPATDPGSGRLVAEGEGVGRMSTGANKGESERTEVSRQPVAKPKLGSLLVRVTWAEDKTPAAGVLLKAGTLGVGDVLFDHTYATTGADGTLRLTDLKPGPMYVECHWGFPGRGRKRATIEAGKEVEVQLEIPVGFNFDGIVVDQAGNPVAGADILIAPWNRAPAHSIAKTAADGRFRLRSLVHSCSVGARALGHAPSPMHQVAGRKGTNLEVRIVLGGRCGALHGRVLGPRGDPVPNAVIQITDAPRQVVELPAGGSGVSAAPVRVRSDGDGCFVAEGLAPGKTHVEVRARGLAPWTGTADILANGSSELVVHLLPGVTLTGTVRDGNGDAMDKVLVTVGDWRTLVFHRTMTDAAGSYRLEGLGHGKLKIEASADPRGKAETKLVAVAGQTLQWDPVISKGLVLRGRVVDENDKPVKAPVIAMLANPGPKDEWWYASDWTDKEGWFELRNCQPGKGIRIAVHPQSANVEKEKVVYVKPDRQDLVIRVPSTAEPTVHVAGQLLGPDDKPVAAGWITLLDRQGGTSSRRLRPDTTTGRFKTGPYPPGEYRVSVRANRYRVLQTTWKHVAQNKTWDLGVIRLQHPGFLQVTLKAEAGLLPRRGSFRILDAAKDYLGSIPIREGKADRSNPLAPGTYYLQVLGKEFLCALHRFEIHAGQDTRLEVPLAKGIAVVLEFFFQTDVGAVVPRGEAVDVEIRDSGGRTIVARFRSYHQPTIAFAVRPGRYQVTAASRTNKRAEVALTVGDKPADPKRIVLR